MLLVLELLVSLHFNGTNIVIICVKEFTSSNDDKCKWYIEPAPNGTMFLLNKNYAGRSNANNTPGWYLSMSFDGVLSSNGYKCELSQWALVAAGLPPAPVPAAPQPVAAIPPPAPAPAPAAPAPAPAPVVPRLAPPPSASSSASSTSLPPPGGEVEMEEVTNFHFNPLFANRPPPAESASASSAATNSSIAASAAAGAAAAAAAASAAAGTSASHEPAPAAAPAPVVAPAGVVAAAAPAAAAPAPRPVSMSHAYSTTTPGTVAYPNVPPVNAATAAAVAAGLAAANAHAAGRPTLVQAQSVSNIASAAPLTFPGHDAGRDALMRYFLTPGGVTFLQQPQYAAAFALYNAGTLGRVLHRYVDFAFILFTILLSLW